MQDGPVQDGPAQDGIAPLPPLTQAQAQDWLAIGRIRTRKWFASGACTGALIAPDVVLTAGHCAGPSANDPTRELYFLAAPFESIDAGQRRIIGSTRHPAYRIGGRHTPRFDIGLLFLESPFDDITPLPLAPIPLDQLAPPQAALIGYHRLRPFRPTGRIDCPILNQSPQLLTLGCRVINGNSGSPIMHFAPGGAPRVVAVTSSQAGPNAIAAVLGDWLHRTLAEHTSN